MFTCYMLQFKYRAAFYISARERAAFDTRDLLAVVASCAGPLVALEDMPKVGAVGIDCLVTAEQTRNFVANTSGVDAGL